MAMSPQAVAFGIQAVIRLGQAAKRGYEAKILDASITLPSVNVARLDTPSRALQIVSDAMMDGRLRADEWRADHDLVQTGDTSPAGLAAQSRVIDAAARLDAKFASKSELEGFAVLEQWHSDANRMSPLARVGLELADLALDYIGANPALFGVKGNGEKLVMSIAVSLGELLPDPDDPSAEGSSFASGAIRIFAEAGLRALDQNVDRLIDEDHLQDLARSTLKPLIDAVAAGDTADQPWYDLRDEFLGPVAEAAIDSLARNQVAILGDEFEADSKVGALTQSVLLAIKDKGLADDLGKEGVIRIYQSVLDTIVARPGVFFRNAQSDADVLTERLLINATKHLKDNSPPFNKSLGAALIASSFETVSANAPLLVKIADIDAGDWTSTLAQISETLVREISTGVAEGLAAGNRPDLLRRIFNEAQGAEFLDLILEQVATTPGMVVGNAAPEIKTLVRILAHAMAEQKSVLLSADDWLAVTRTVAREVAANPGRLIKTGLASDDEELLFKLLSGVLTAAANSGGRDAGSVLFGPTLVEVLQTVVETAAGNAAKALVNCKAVQELAQGLAVFAQAHRDAVGRLEWLVLFRHYIARVMDTGQLPDFDAAELLKLLLEE
jgi:hypothetical protein